MYQDPFLINFVLMQQSTHIYYKPQIVKEIISTPIHNLQPKTENPQQITNNQQPPLSSPNLPISKSPHLLSITHNR